MKLLQLPVKIFLVLSWLILATESVRSQSGNMSDITMPSPDAMVTEPPTESEPVTETPNEDVTTGEEGLVTEEPLTNAPTEDTTVGEGETATSNRRSYSR